MFCILLDCSTPFGTSEVTIEPYNNTKFGASVKFFCKNENSSNSVTAVCGSDGQWDPDPASLNCNTPITGRYFYIIIVI